MYKHCHGPDNVFTVPLAALQKYYESDDEADNSCCLKPKEKLVENLNRMLRFNEELVICYYKPKDPPTEVQKELEKCWNDPALHWVNPSFRKKAKSRVSLLESTNH
jgi:hypothetical protein